jgi:hypothetical protein
MTAYVPGITETDLKKTFLLCSTSRPDDRMRWGT